MRAALVLDGRSPQPMGLELSELRLLDALTQARNGAEIDVRVVGGRLARTTARRVGGRWYPSLRGRPSPLAWRGADVVHLVGMTVPPPSRRPFVATIHDLSPLHFDDEGALSPWTAEVAARAAAIVCPSRFTGEQVESLLGVPPERVRVVANGPVHRARAAAPLDAEERRRLGLGETFVLRLGGYTARKNVPLLLEAWPEVRRRTGATLALVGPQQPARDRVLAAAPSLDGVVVLDYAADELVVRLLRSAAALVSTSTYEGFGLPPLEAMAAGTPVVAVRAPFVEEVCGDAALLVPNEPAALADALSRVVADAELRRRLAEAGNAQAQRFSWPGAAEALLRLYEEVA